MIELSRSDPIVDLAAIPAIADEVIAPRRNKRDLTPHEQKVDWRSMQVEDALAVQGGRLRLGLILAAQMEALIDWIRRPAFSMNRLNSIPESVMLTREIKREFLRQYLRAYFDGSEAYLKWKNRYLRERGKAELQDQVIVTFGDREVNYFARFADRLGQAAIHSIETRIMPALESTWSPNGTRIKSAEDLEGELRSIYANNLIEKAEVPRDAQILELARRMKIRNRAQYDKWQKRKVPFSKWIGQSAADIAAGKYPPAQLQKHLSTRWLRTERTRFHSHGVLDAVRDDQDVQWLQFSAGDEPCPICTARDGTIRRKDDDFWAFNTPPLHHGCTDCRLVPIFRDERVRVTAKKDIPAPDDIPDGYGLYDPRKVTSARLLGIGAKERYAKPRRPKRRRAAT
jgi:hypothetical protein